MPFLSKLSAGSRVWVLLVFLVLGTLSGVGLVFLTPPLQVPDESLHITRSYLMAGGQWMLERGPDRLGGYLPDAMVRLFAAYSGVSGRPERKVLDVPWRELWRDRIDPEQVTFINHGSGFLTPPGYMAPAAGMAVGRWLDVSPLALLYLGRLANLVLWLLLVSLALALCPRPSWLLVVLALAPMSIFQAASTSHDVLINGLAWLAVGLVWHGLGRTELPSARRHYLALGLVVLLMALSKPAYLPVVALLILPAWSAGRRARWEASLLAVGVGILSVVVWQVVVARYFLTYEQFHPTLQKGVAAQPGVNPSAQLHYIIAHPLYFLGLAWRAVTEPGIFYSWVGVLGWLDTWLPRWVYPFFTGLLVALLGTETSGGGPAFRGGSRAWFLLVGLSMILFLAASLYGQWNAVGSTMLNGLQGRYFTPVTLFLLTALSVRLIPLPPLLLNLLVPLALLALQSATWLALLRRYY